MNKILKKSESNLSLSNTLNNLMSTNNLTSLDLSEKTGVSPVAITRIKNGTFSNPSINTLKSISKFFNINVSQLIGEINI